MYLKRNKKTGIVESFDDNGNKISEVITIGDEIGKEEKDKNK